MGENGRIEQPSPEKAEALLSQAIYISEKLGPDCAIEIALGAKLIDILFDTELPEKFQIFNTVSVENAKVEPKYNNLLNIPELQTVEIIPAYMTQEYPISFEEETKKKAPWVNMVHAWIKVLNYSNTLSAIQRGHVEEEMIRPILATIAQDLYAFTTESDKKLFSRTSGQFRNKQKYPETILRESGTEGVNSARHVSFEEMMYILEAMKKAFKKE